ncbi:DUF3179 domain-containing (seleno)protein [Halobacillus yeomjeoni]|uniref:DUF3179 domain-containing protein n=1 Tax=Halobacillus yeomjeoni TaxID=311194 RepID=A0A931HUF9_9BACI|nr:DUF3179 domain-containing (seleno)protein [Halobacillus yeomjeoni]MBH0229421.1 DUF3179 domain-containing protein [Halobacillus yeomjeoni]
MPFSHNPIHPDQIKKAWPHTNFNRSLQDLWTTLQDPRVPRDGIPPLDRPSFTSADTLSSYIDREEAMIVIEGESEVRAYPVDDVMLHEIVNDYIDKVPVAVTFCPLCNSAIVFKRIVQERVLRLGVSGMLRNNDLIIWDDQTESWWQQFTGEAIAGDYYGQQLEMVPSLILAYEQVLDRYPQASILVRTEEDPLPPAHQTGDFKQRGPKMVDTSKVIAAHIDGTPVAFRFESLKEKKVLTTIINEKRYVVFFNEKVKDMGIERKEIQGQAFMYEARLNEKSLTFEVGSDGILFDVETSTKWSIYGEAVEGQLEGSHLNKVTTYPHFKAPWFKFYPNSIYIQ